jgi:uncharacterized membrane protein HdeD (DUF308 family)
MATDTLVHEASRRAGWSIVLGVLTAVIGVAMILYPFATAAISTVFLGSALFVAGVTQAVLAFTSETAGRFFLTLVLGILYAVTGIVLAFFPVVGVFTLTAWLGAMLIAEAVLEGIMAFQVPAGMGRGWVLLSALTSLALGVLILAQWPGSSAWAIGTLVGVAVLMNGITRTAISIWARREISHLPPMAHAA